LAQLNYDSIPGALTPINSAIEIRRACFAGGEQELVLSARFAVMSKTCPLSAGRVALT